MSLLTAALYRLASLTNRLEVLTSKSSLLALALLHVLMGVPAVCTHFAVATDVRQLRQYVLEVGTGSNFEASTFCFRTILVYSRFTFRTTALCTRLTIPACSSTLRWPRPALRFGLLYICSFSKRRSRSCSR